MGGVVVVIGYKDVSDSVARKNGEELGRADTKGGLDFIIWQHPNIPILVYQTEDGTDLGGYREAVQFLLFGS